MHKTTYFLSKSAPILILPISFFFLFVKTIKMNTIIIYMIINKDLAYWVGVAQTDGYLKVYTERETSKTRFIFRLTVGRKSLPMLYKFQNLSDTLLNRKAKICYYKSNDYEHYEFHIGIGKILEVFRKLEISFSKPPTPPAWSLGEPQFFGAYLAGVIDGDGNVKYRRPQYLQCVIRISSKKPPLELEEAIENLLQCSVCIIKDRNAYSLEFCISHKNYDFIKNYVLPQLSLAYKKDKILYFLQMKWPQ